MRLKSLNFQMVYKIEVMGREEGYKIRNKEGIHFITFVVVEWIDVFTRKRIGILYWKVFDTVKKKQAWSYIVGAY